MIKCINDKCQNVECESYNADSDNNCIDHTNIHECPASGIVKQKKQNKLLKKVIGKLMFNVISIKFWILATGTVLLVLNYITSDNLTMLFMAYLGVNVGQKLIGNFTKDKNEEVM